MSDIKAPKFGELALEHLDALYGYALTLTRNESEAEDLVQETYLRATRAVEKLAPDSELKRWLFVIMRNAWLNQLRHTRSGPHFVELTSEDELVTRDEATGNNPHVLYLRKLEQHAIETAIASLPDLYREIIRLRDVEGFSYQEIATMLGCPAGTVMSRLGRAREKLRRMLGQWHPARAAGAR
jgi:RNA polymerase sigma-70 factor (ECF subfamily)